jgi:sec-independent protein translocase protein TatB
VFNISGSEVVIILLVALIVLGPDKLPDAVRKAGRFYGELRRMSTGFQAELREALDEPLREVRDTVDTMRSGFTVPDDAPQAPMAPALPDDAVDAVPVADGAHDAAGADEAQLAFDGLLDDTDPVPRRPVTQPEAVEPSPER